MGKSKNKTVKDSSSAHDPALDKLDAIVKDVQEPARAKPKPKAPVSDSGFSDDELVLVEIRMGEASKPTQVLNVVRRIIAYKLAKVLKRDIKWGEVVIQKLPKGE